MSVSVTPPLLAALLLADFAALAMRADGSPWLGPWTPLLQLPLFWVWARRLCSHAKAGPRPAAGGLSRWGLDAWLTAVAIAGGAGVAAQAGRIDLALLAATLYVNAVVGFGWLAEVLARVEAAGRSGRPRAALAAAWPTWAGLVVMATAVLASPAATRSGVPDYRHHFWSHVLNCGVTAAGAAGLSGQSIYSLGEDYSRLGQAVVIGATCLSGLLMTALGLAMIGPLLARPIRQSIVMGVTIAALLIGTALLLPVWNSHDAPAPASRLGWSLTHAAGALFNAGWTLKPSGLATELRHPLAFSTISTLALLGAIGVPVMMALLRPAPRQAPALAAWPTWETATAAAALIFTANGLFFFETPRFLAPVMVPARPVEFDGALASLRDTMSHGERWSRSTFAAATRTAGFQSFTLAEGGLSWPGYGLMLASGLVGGSISGTAGGLRLSAVALAALLVFSRRAGPFADAAARRRLLARLALIPVTMLLMTGAAVVAMRLTCDGTWYEIIFDTTAACSNVGLSTGLTLHLPWPGRLMLIGFIAAGRFLPMYLWAVAVSTISPLAHPAGAR